MKYGGLVRGNSRGRFRLALTLLAALILGALPAGLASPAFAAASGSISGTVTAPAGVDLTQISVQAMAGPTYRNVQVKADGGFSLTGLEAGQYKVSFGTYLVPQLVSTWYGSYTESQATIISVADGAAVAGINQAMKIGGKISGKVSVPAGVDASKVGVDVHVGSGATTYAAADGSYTVIGLPTGSFEVQFNYFSTPSPVLSGYYSTSPDGTRTLVSVTEGETTTGINQALRPAALISGKISVPAGSGGFAGQIDAIKGPDFASGGASGTAFLQGTDPSGNYTIGGLEPGVYKLRFQAQNGWASMWHGGVSEAGKSTAITVVEGQHLSGVQDSAVAAATISGSITGGPVPGPTMSGPGMNITAVTPDGTVAASTVMETSQTTYALKNLLPGSYKIQFNRTAGFMSTYEAQLYKDLPESAGAANATSVAVAAGQTVPNVNAAVRTGGTLTGKLVGSNGAAIRETLVSVFTKDGSLVTRAGWTAADGTFRVTGLTTGLYFVSAEPGSESGPIFSGNVLTEANARSVSAFVGQNTDIGTLSYATATEGTRGFDDVPLGAQFQDEIQWLATKGISTGWEANRSRTYQPLTPVNRDAMAAFMYRLSGSPAFTAPKVSPFKDLPSDAKFYKEITWLADKGISTGWEEADKTKTYRPLQPVNRDAMAAFMYRLAGEPEFTAPKVSPFVDVPVGAQFYKEITWLAAQGISTGWAEAGNTKSFKPLQAVNRDAMAAFMFRYNTKFGAN
ncbi:S-layer homology domain-containing protein [Paenarthrobacter sp. NPDC056912]|uniref:S-layer homology domain-containing protein n=1 Tax=Paenarthrobacter sp. NPDC056912 TaxID=3345965 RepID=UPI00366B1895